jgi:hypothetical protein
MLAVVHRSNGRPEGQTYKVAGPTDGSFLITALGDLRESCDRFVQDTLMASLPVEGALRAFPLGVHPVG